MNSRHLRQLFTLFVAVIVKFYKLGVGDALGIMLVVHQAYTASRREIFPDYRLKISFRDHTIALAKDGVSQRLNATLGIKNILVMA